MKSFIGNDFLLTNDRARALYHDYAENLPIFDYHCHLDPREIYDNPSYENITELWLLGDHYKWRLMRAAGIPEQYITGNADPYEKFLKWAETISKCIGNPLYHWSHMELKKYFGISDFLTVESARNIWDSCCETLKVKKLRARDFITNSNVYALCTTDDPLDSLAHHEALAADSSFSTRVLPTFRPEIALHPEHADYLKWIMRLSDLYKTEVDCLKKLEDLLESRVVFFKNCGCLVADQSLASPDFTCGTREQAERAFSLLLKGETLSPDDYNAYQTELMRSLGRIYSRNDLVMQLHFGVLRNNNTRYFEICGADSGFDAVGDGISAASISAFFNSLDSTDELPKTIIYSLNANDDDKLASVLGCFQEKYFPQKMQLGAPWWFSDHKSGMEKQMLALANTGVLAGFVGMLTDSRSLLSYPRHEYFRRVLCNLLGTWMKTGYIPSYTPTTGEIVKNISFYNAKAYFKL